MKSALLILTLFASNCLAQSGAANLSKCQYETQTQWLSVSSSTAVEFFNISLSSYTMANRQAVCLTNLDTSSSDFVQVTSFSTTNSRLGSVIFGTQTGCFDWGRNIKVFVYQKATQAAADVAASQCQ